MKSKISIFCMFAFLSGFSQQVKFRLYVRHQCTGYVERFSLYALSNSAGGLFFPKDTSGICCLGSAGLYYLYFGGEIREYQITDLALVYTDTVNLPSIIDCYKMHSFSGVCCCESSGSNYNGYHIDYYTSGRIRAQGYFKNGKAIGKVKYYNIDGSINKVLFFNSKNVLKRIRERKTVFD